MLNLIKSQTKQLELTTQPTKALYVTIWNIEIKTYFIIETDVTKALAFSLI